MKTLLIALSLSAALFSTDALSKDHRDDRQSHNGRQDHSKHDGAKRSNNKHTQRDNRQSHNRHQDSSRHHRSHNSNHGHRNGHKKHVSPAHRPHHSPKYVNKHKRARYDRHGKVIDRIISHHERKVALVGGLILGSMIHHKAHNRHGNVYWEDDYGTCYRVEGRAHGDVYIEVPHYKCH